MNLHRWNAQAELIGDLFVEESAGHELTHFTLTRRQPGE
jgi:hypothetical protein